MDPFNALSIAAGVVAFVDFGAKLVSQYLEVRKSEDGRPAGLSALQTESEELSANATHARDKIASLRVRYPAQSECLDRLATECTQVEEELQSLVSSLTPRSGRGLKTGGAQVLASIRGLLKQDEIDSLRGRLRSIREQTMMSIIMCISYVNFPPSVLLTLDKHFATSSSMP